MFGPSHLDDGDNSAARAAGEEAVEDEDIIIHRLSQHKVKVQDLDFSPNDKFIATIGGQDLLEIIVLEPQSKVTFFQATGPREGAIINELFEDEAGELQLKFYCYLGLRDKEPAGPEEQAEQAQFDSDKGYKAALLSTLKRTRELLADGTL